MKVWCKLFLVVSILMLFVACDSGRVFDDNKSIPGNAWFHKNAVPFEIQVTDTTKLYNVYVNVRINSEYKYSNIFMWLNTTNPQKKMDQRRIEIRLADEGGKWLGHGLGDIFDYQFPVFQKIKFPNSGFYRFELEQNMRDDTLMNVKAVGIRVEIAE
ncbi:MAG: gliding motility lipoprotein GldH [Bacteroidota bacterium]